MGFLFFSVLKLTSLSINRNVIADTGNVTDEDGATCLQLMLTNDDNVYVGDVADFKFQLPPQPGSQFAVKVIGEDISCEEPQMLVFIERNCFNSAECSTASKCRLLQNDITENVTTCLFECDCDQRSDGVHIRMSHVPWMRTYGNKICEIQYVN